MDDIRHRFRRRSQRGSAAAGLPALEDVEVLMAYEVARARRYQRPLSFIALPSDAVAARHIPLRLSDCAAVARRRRRVVLMLPDTDAAGAASLAARLREMTPASADVAVATFPTDGLTLDDLLAAVLEPRSRVAEGARS